MRRLFDLYAFLFVALIAAWQCFAQTGVPLTGAGAFKQSGGSSVSYGGIYYTGNQTGLLAGTWTVATPNPSSPPTCVAFLFFEYPGNSLPSAVTYGGTGMSLAVQQDSPGTMAPGFLYGLASPPSGSQALAVTVTEAADITGYLIWVTNSNTSSCFRTSSPTALLKTSGAASISQSVTSDTGDLVIDSVGSYQTETWAAGGSQSVLGANTAAAANTSVSSLPGAATSTTMSWTYTSNPVTQIAASIQHQ
jgi:hypothetical protein